MVCDACAKWYGLGHLTSYVKISWSSQLYPYCFLSGSQCTVVAIIILYDETARIILACMSQTSYLWVWDVLGFTWRVGWGQESWTQHSPVRRDMDPSPDCPSVCAQVSRPMELLDLIQMWTGCDIICLQFKLIRNKDLFLSAFWSLLHWVMWKAWIQGCGFPNRQDS